MRVTVSHVFHGEKCSYVNYQRPDSCDVFYNVALAFPKSFNVKPGESPLDIPLNEFYESLEPGKEVDIRWSKSLSSFVVRF